MINALYCIFDEVAKEYGPVFEAKNDDVAIRNFNSSLTQVAFKSDFSLFCVGSIDHETGIISAKDEPEYIEIPFAPVTE